MGFATTTVDVETRDEAKAWIIRNQLGRRNLTPYQRAGLALALKPLVEGQAKERMLAGRKPDPKENFPQGRGQSRDELAKVARVSGRTIDKVERIARDAVPELRAAASRGEVSIDAAAKVATLPESEQREAVKGGKEGVKQAAKTDEGQNGIMSGSRPIRLAFQQKASACADIRLFVGRLAQLRPPSGRGRLYKALDNHQLSGGARRQYYQAFLCLAIRGSLRGPLFS